MASLAIKKPPLPSGRETCASIETIHADGHLHHFMPTTRSNSLQGTPASPSLLYPHGRANRRVPSPASRPGGSPYLQNNFPATGGQFVDSDSSNSSCSSVMATLPEAGASVEEWTAYAMQMQDALKESRDAQALAAKEKQALVDVLAMQSSMKPPVANTHHRKPELPPFSKKDIENWIRRVKNAYTRVGILDAKSKFAFLENIIGTETTPTINAFMVHPNPTDATWEAFLEHLTQRYGRTTQQQAQSVLRNFKRHGRTPEDMWAHMLEQVGDLTLHDVLKENIYQELPAAVRQHLSGDLPTMTPAALAKAANRFFDRDGNLENAEGNSVNQVHKSQASYAHPSSNDVSEFEPIHHVGGCPQSRPQFTTKGKGGGAGRSK